MFIYRLLDVSESEDSNSVMIATASPSKVIPWPEKEITFTQ